MSRVAKNPISLPKGVEVVKDQAGLVTVKGPKGTLMSSVHPLVEVVIEGAQIAVIGDVSDDATNDCPKVLDFGCHDIKYPDSIQQW